MFIIELFAKITFWFGSMQLDLSLVLEPDVEPCYLHLKESEADKIVCIPYSN